MVRLISFRFRLSISLIFIVVAGAWFWNSRTTVWYPNAIVFSPNEQYRDNFGATIAVDQETVVAGAPGDRSAGTPGSAYVYVPSNSGWRLEATLHGREFSQGIYDGFSNRISIDENTIITLDERSGLRSFYKFERQGTTWSQVKPTVLDPANTLRNQQIVEAIFAEDVAIDGDALVIGAREAAYVFTRTAPNTWTYETQLTLPESQSPKATDKVCYFGSSVAISGDTIVVGSRSIFGPRYCANVFVRQPKTRKWIHQALLLPKRCRSLNACNNLEGFGYSVAIEDDTIVVGTAAKLPGPLAHCNVSGGDAAYIFERDRESGNWQQTAVLGPKGIWESVMATRCGFGEAVAVASDRVLVSGVDSSTAPHLFKRHPSTGQWQYEATLSVDPNKVNLSGRDDFARRIGLANPFAVGSIGLSTRFAIVGHPWLSETEQTSNQLGAFSVFDLQITK
ncbi:MAG: hypothetical protein IGS54_09920 [Elainella sp. C42_A2020_010]|nr:hypothetical protein [Elainella sp. C42_A2020_010]